jgi:mannose-6-phosphate isomerase-like protein (cupin superfamily)
MRRVGLWAISLAWAAAAPATAQTAPASLDPITFAASADVQALVARAKATIKPGQPSLVQPLLRLAPYRAALEYRVAGTPANTHINEAEFVYILQGSGTVVLGGALIDGKVIGKNIIGTTIEGGTPRHLAAGDVFIVPANTPHWFNQIDGTMVMISMHLPQPPAP